MRAGLKSTHWIWYIFPLVEGLGSSRNSQYYAIKSMGEARAYLAHPVLCARLTDCADLVLTHSERPIESILGLPDDAKFLSSMTLFALVSEPGSIFHRCLKAFFGGRADERTETILGFWGA